MIGREPQAAAEREHDLVVIGGGIHGVALTLEAAQRGLRPLLLERDDFGGATSWNSLRIIHGGLRYLQTMDLPRYRQSVAERSWFMRNFPDQVVPLPCLMPLTGNGLRRRSVFAAALTLDRVLSPRRNAGLPADRVLEAGRTLGPRAAAALCPVLEPDTLRGAALWNDAVMPHAPRVLIEMLRWAVALGAQALNYVQVTGLAIHGDRVASVTAKDGTTGREYEFHARRVANCAGPWCRELSAVLDRERPELFRPAMAFNLLLDREPTTDFALAVSNPDRNRSFFIVPWRNRLMAGTCHLALDPDQGTSAPEESSVDEFLSELAAAAPGLELDRASVLRVLWGRVPAARAGGATPATRARVVRHSDHGGPSGLVSASGVKYTTARALAESTLGTLFGSDLPETRDRPRPEPAGWPSADELRGAGGDDPEVVARVRRLAADESVVEPDDLLLRRTDLGLDPEVGNELRPRIERWLGGGDAT